MMVGEVVNRRAILPITFVLHDRGRLNIEFVLDTGYTDYITLPTSAVSAMRFPFRHRVSVRLADGSRIEINVHVATIIWHGREIDVPVFATGNTPLLGTALLDACDLTIRFIDGSPVTVSEV